MKPTIGRIVTYRARGALGAALRRPGRHRRTDGLPYPSDFHRKEAERHRQQPGLSGAAKRRKRKGGNPKGGPGLRGEGAG